MAFEPALLAGRIPQKKTGSVATRPPVRSEPKPELKATSQGMNNTMPTGSALPEGPSAAVESMTAGSPGAVSHQVKKGDTIDALKKRLFPDLSDADRASVRVEYAGEPDKPVVPKRIQPGEKLTFTPLPVKAAEVPVEKPAAFTPPAISAGFQKKLEAVAKKQGFEVNAFTDKVTAMATKYKMDPNALLAVMNCETAGTFSPSVKNPDNGATGLIQFTKTTAKSLRTSTEALAKMSAVKQLDYVDKYLGGVLKGQKDPLSDTDVYLSVFYPGKVGQGANPDAVIFSRKTRPVAYRLNKSLDTLDDQGKAGSDGVITSAEILKRLKQWYPEE